MRATLHDEETVAYFIGAGSRPLRDVDETALRRLIVDEQKKWGEMVRKLGPALN